MNNTQIADAMVAQGHGLVADLDNEIGVDYLLQEGASVWLTIRNLVVHVVARDEGVSVEILPNPLTEAFEQCIAETWATWGEGYQEDL